MVASANLSAKVGGPSSIGRMLVDIPACPGCESGLVVIESSFGEIGCER